MADMDFEMDLDLGLGGYEDLAQDIDILPEVNLLVP